MRMWTLRDYLPRRSASTCWRLGVCVLLLARPAPMAAADAVRYVRSTQRTPVSQTGTIVDYTGASLTLELAGGRHLQIPAGKIIAVETTRNDSHVAADRLLADGHPAQALTLYRRAVREEQRTWMRRWILADMSRCYAQVGQLPQACDTFMILARSDPQTPWFDAIPLCWTARSTPDDMRRRAESWLGSADSNIETLLAASWLITVGPQRAKAIDQLRQLTTLPDPRIAGLAAAQLWRTRLATATIEDAAAWKTQLAKLPASLRAGPDYLLGKVLARLDQPRQAALASMRVPILFPKQRRLAAEALWTAGQQLERMKQPEEAARVYHELASRHDDHPLAAMARARISALSRDH